MCGPAALMGISLAIGAAQSVAGYMGQSQAASQQQQYENQQAVERNQQIVENNKLAQQSYQQQAEQENLRLIQEQAKDTQDKEQNRINMMQSAATTSASAGESGVSGISVDRLLTDFYRQNSMFNDSVNQNYEYQSLQSRGRIKGYKNEAIGRMQSIQPYLPRQIQGPSFLGTALEIGSQVVGTASKYSAYRRGS